MEAAHDNRRQLGQLMVDEGFLTLDQLSIALAEQDRTGSPLGKLLVDLGFVSQGAVANALAEQHGGLLKTEFGVSAGLAPVSAETPFIPGSAAPEPPDRATRILQLETALHAVVTERDQFAERVDELLARLNQTAPTNGAESNGAGTSAAAAARIAELEAEVQARTSESQAHEAEVGRVTAAAVAHINGLEAKLLEAQSTETPQPERIAELEAELARVTAAAEDRIGELAAELQTVASRSSEPDEDMVARATIAEARVAELEAEVARASTAAAGRIGELEAALQARPSEPAPTQPDEAEIARVTEEAAARIAELESELQTAIASRTQLEAGVALGTTRISELEHEVRELREQAEQLQQEEQAVADAAVEAAVEHAHLLLTPAASGYTLVERPGPAPASGTLLDVDGVGFAVLRVGVSPFPGNGLRCAFLDRV